MKDIELTKKLLAELKSLTSNDFELHRVEVLEKDLTEGLPVFEVIDDKQQKFNGVTYHKHVSGHFYSGSTIHREVYNYYYGEIPQGHYNIHHINGNPADNDILNLQCLTATEHKRLHNLEKPYNHYICEVCGKNFVSRRLDEKIRFCSKQCRNKYYSELKEIRICQYCGKEFTTNVYSDTIFCSQTCKNLDYWSKKPKVKKICPACGKTFEPPRNHQIYCSKSCRSKFNARKVKDKICAFCGKSFKPSKSTSKFCSRSCLAKSTWAKRKS